MFNLSNLKAIFFDLDDVLVFSETTHTKAWKMSLPQFGINPDEIDFQALVGICDMQQATRFKEQFNLEETPEALFEVKRNKFIELTNSGLESPPGRNALLEVLSQSYILGVVSSSVRNVVNHVLTAEKILPLFQFVIAYEDCVRHKPDPLPYQQALSKAGVEPHEALVIEDSLSGITAAQRASIPVMGILKNQRADQLVKNISYFNDFSEIYLKHFDFKQGLNDGKR